MHSFLRRACRTNIYLFPIVKYGGTCAMLNFEIICILKVGNNDKFLKIVSEYDQEIPQSQTADNHMAPRGRATISIKVLCAGPNIHLNMYKLH